MFMDAYNKYPPKKIVIWFFKYFSSTTKTEDNWLSKLLMWDLIFLILLGIIMSAFKQELAVAIITWVFVGILVPFCVLGFYCVIQNNIRIRKICKELNLNLIGYNKYVNEYLK